MTNCLGIYFDDNIVKYAKLVKNNVGKVEIKEHGIKFVKSTLKETLQNILNDTNCTKDVPIVINAPKIEYNVFQVFRQISNSDLQNIIKLEFDDWCEKKGIGAANFSYVYSLSTSVIGDYRRGLMGVCSKALVEEYSKIAETKVAAMYPTELLSPIDKTIDDKNYVLINLDKKLSVTTILENKAVYTSFFELGMTQILEKFIDILGSYEKAYEACKQLNVFSDADSDTNKVQLEEIVEPILQEILHSVSEDVNRHKDIITKIYITGSSTLFTNIDTLFTEYFGIRCEILKPGFVTDVGGVRNIAEILEVLPAITLGKEYLEPVTTGLEFIKNNVVKPNILDIILGKNKKDDNLKDKPKKEVTEKKLNLSMLPKITIEKVTQYMLYPIIVSFLGVITYFIFSNIYMNQVTKMKNNLNTKVQDYDGMITLAKADKKTIDASTNKYKTVNDEITKLKQQIETNQIGKLTTYNVASFMQKIIKIIPANVQLKTISSDDNKKVKIVAQSSQYQNLGYFVANLRLQPDILANVVINSVTNGDTVAIEIGGDLP